MNAEQSLWEKVRRLEALVDVPGIINGEKNSPSQIRSYFKINRLAYRMFQSREGFMHFRISQDGTFSDEDIYYQPNAISEFIKPGNYVLELGPGMGSNLVYLAEKHPDATFYGLDLYPSIPKNAPGNVHIMQQDYSDMSNMADDSFDVVYAVESIVHNTNKDPIFREVHRILKPGGVFIVYDYALCKPFETYAPLTQTAIAMVSKGGAAAMLEPLDAWIGHFTSNGFSTGRITDLTRKLLPDLKRLKHSAEHILKHPALTRFMFALFPDHFVNNIALGYLGYDGCRAGTIGTYKEWVFWK